MEVQRRIQRLPQSVINKIAAGEVIERPASVVKELLENAVDALATAIDVEIDAGGAELIRMTDNGEGIHPEDVELAVTAHATSKLRDAEELFHVRTMGFRGEALASIAEVSRFRLRSRRAEQLTGVEVDVEAGILKEPRACGCPVGTTVEVRQLFLNTPVRRKFLRGAATEFGHIAEQFTRVALAHPNLRLTLRHNGKAVFDLAATARLAERLELFYGSELAGQLIPVEAQSGDARLWGYVAHPAQSKSTRKGQYLFVNGRWVQDRSLQHALGEAYRGLLMVGRYPVAFLFLEVPPDDLDVNVHPTKSEVRFRDSQQLYRLLLSTLRTRFLTLDIAAGHRLEAGATRGETTAAADAALQQQAQLELVSWAQQQLAGWQPRTDLSDLEARVAPPSAEAWRPPPDVDAAADDAGAQVGTSGCEPEAVGPDDPTFQSEPPDTNAQRVPGISIQHVETTAAAARPASAAGTVRAMQVHDCYLVIETPSGLTVIDQHALHERILYEQLRSRVLAGSVEIQRLLMPIPVEMSPREAALAVDQRELLAELGLLVEAFGGATVAVTGYPVLTRRADPVELLCAAVEQLEQAGGQVTRRDLLDALLHMIACKAAIKAGQRLAAEEIESLLAQRDLVDDAHHCPHGRPTALTLSRQDLDRQFGRLG